MMINSQLFHELNLSHTYFRYHLKALKKFYKTNSNLFGQILLKMRYLGKFVKKWDFSQKWEISNAKSLWFF